MHLHRASQPSEVPLVRTGSKVLAWVLLAIAGAALIAPVIVHFWPRSFPEIVLKKSVPMGALILSSLGVFLAAKGQLDLRRRRREAKTNSL